MKKITPKQYALSLYDSIKDVHGEELTQRIRNFLLLIKKRKDLKLLNKIFRVFVSIYQERAGTLATEVISSRSLSEKVKKEIIIWLKERTGRVAQLGESLEPTILGGVIIKFEDTIIDVSLVKRLKNLHLNLIKN